MYPRMTNHMGNLTLLSGAFSRSISRRTFTGAKGAGGQCELEDRLGQVGRPGLGQRLEGKPLHPRGAGGDL